MKIFALTHNLEIREDLRRNNIEDVKKYSVDIAVEKMAGIYEERIGGE